MKNLMRAAVTLSILSSSVFASSRVIRDNRLNDLGISPVLAV